MKKLCFTHKSDTIEAGNKWKVRKMAVQLETLYSKIDPAFEVQLLTKSCFNKMIQWIHMVEDMDFIPLLHGDELVFNSGLNYSSEQWLQEYVEALNKSILKLDGIIDF